jgi:hypothetical protein
MTTHALSTFTLALSLVVTGAGRTSAAPADPPKDKDSAATATPADAAQDAADDDAAFEPVEPGYRLINLPTTLRLPQYKGVFELTHRFAGNFRRGSFGEQAEELFGIDNGATVGFEYRYAIAKHVELAAFRTAFERTIQFYTKIDAVHQNGSTPLSVSIVGSVEGQNNFREDYAPVVGLSVSRKLGDAVAVYMVPLYAHNLNAQDLPDVDNDAFLLGFGGRLRVSPSVFVVAEATPRVSGFDANSTEFGFGIEGRVGGHLFQLNVTNSFGTTLAQTARGGQPENLKLGFNLSRKFF